MFTAMSKLWNSSQVVGKHYRVARQFVHKPQSISYRLVVVYPREDPDARIVRYTVGWAGKDGVSHFFVSSSSSGRSRIERDLGWGESVRYSV